MIRSRSRKFWKSRSGQSESEILETRSRESELEILEFRESGSDILPQTPYWQHVIFMYRQC